MGKLHELLMKKVEGNIRSRYEQPQEPQEEVIHTEAKMYNQTWLLKVTNEGGYIVNRDRDKAQKVLDALNRRNGQCPCGGEGKQFKCPCVVMRDHGICKCGLFENVRSVEPKGKSTAKIKVKE